MRTYTVERCVRLYCKEMGERVADVYKEIVGFMAHQKNSKGKETFRTREVADAVGLTIYQTRLHLEALQSLDVVEKINSGKGVPGIWRLR